MIDEALIFFRNSLNEGLSYYQKCVENNERVMYLKKAIEIVNSLINRVEKSSLDIGFLTEYILPQDYGYIDICDLPEIENKILKAWDNLWESFAEDTTVKDLSIFSDMGLCSDKLGKSLINNTSIRSLRIGGKYLRIGQFNTLGENSSIRYLELFSRRMGAGNSLVDLAKSLKNNNSMRSLFIRLDDIGTVFIPRVAEELNGNSTLIELAISVNDKLDDSEITNYLSKLNKTQIKYVAVFGLLNEKKIDFNKFAHELNFFIIKFDDVLYRQLKFFWDNFHKIQKTKEDKKEFLKSIETYLKKTYVFKKGVFTEKDVLSLIIFYNNDSLLISDNKIDIFDYLDTNKLLIYGCQINDLASTDFILTSTDNLLTNKNKGITANKCIEIVKEFFNALHHGKKHTIQTFLNEGFDLSQFLNEKGENIIWLLLNDKLNPNIYEIVLSNFDLLQKNIEGYNSLEYAISKYHVDKVKLLLNYFPKSKLNSKLCRDNQTFLELALHLLIYSYVTRLVNKLFYSKSTFDESNISKLITIIRLLVDAGCYPETTNHLGITNQLQAELFISIVKGDSLAAKDLINKIGCNIRTYEQLTPLHFALLLETKLEIVKLFLDDKNLHYAEDIWGFTPLHFAIFTNNVSIINHIIDISPNILNSKLSNNNFHRNYSLCEFGYPEKRNYEYNFYDCKIFCFLISVDINFNIFLKNYLYLEDVFSFIINFVKVNFEDVVINKFIENPSFDPNLKFHYPESAITHLPEVDCNKHCQLSLLNYLILKNKIPQLKAVLSRKDIIHDLRCNYLIDHCEDDVCDMLEIVLMKSVEGFLPLQFALILGNLEAAEILYSTGKYDINATFTYILQEREIGDLEDFIYDLADFKIDENDYLEHKLFIKKSTILHCIISCGRYKKGQIKLLLDFLEKNNFDFFQEDQKGLLALDYACACQLFDGAEEIIEFYISYFKTNISLLKNLSDKTKKRLLSHVILYRDNEKELIEILCKFDTFYTEEIQSNKNEKTKKLLDHNPRFQYDKSNEFSSNKPSNIPINGAASEKISYEEKLTSLVYELKRHDWMDHTCRELIKNIIYKNNTPIEVIKAIKKRDITYLENHLLFLEINNGRYYGENLSDDSDSDQETQICQQPNLLSKNELLQESADWSYGKLKSDLEKISEQIQKIKDEYVNDYNCIIENPCGVQVDLNTVENNKRSLSELKSWLKNGKGQFNGSGLGKRIYNNTIIKIIKSKKIPKKVLSSMLDDLLLFNRLITISDERENAFSDFTRFFENILSLKKITTSIFDSSFLNKMPYEENPSDQQKKDLMTLNISLAGNKKPPKLDTSFVVYLARGNMYLTTLWNQPSRRMHREMDEVNQRQYAASVYKSTGIPLFNKKLKLEEPISEDDLEKLNETAKRLRELMQKLKNSLPVVYRLNNKEYYLFNNMNELLQHHYTNEYDSIPDVLKDIKNYLESKNYDKDDIALLNESNVFVSFGHGKHANAYALNIKPYAGKENQRLRPRWTVDCRAERPKVGKTYHMLLPVKNFYCEKNFEPDIFNQVPMLVYFKRISSNYIITAENEHAFYGYSDPNFIFATDVTKYPSFHHKKFLPKIFMLRYGLDEKNYTFFKEAIQKTRPHSVLRKIVKEILGCYLNHFLSIKYARYADLYAKSLGKLLVYTNYKMEFSFKPKTVTFRGPKNKKEEKEKEMNQKVQELRKFLAKKFRDDNESILFEINEKSYFDLIEKNRGEIDKNAVDELTSALKGSFQDFNNNIDKQTGKNFSNSSDIDYSSVDIDNLANKFNSLKASSDDYMENTGYKKHKTNKRQNFFSSGTENRNTLPTEERKREPIEEDIKQNYQHFLKNQAEKYNIADDNFCTLEELQKIYYKDEEESSTYTQNKKI